MSLGFRVKEIEICTVSKLMANQVVENYDVKEPNLVRYQVVAIELWSQFKSIELHKIPREKNTRAGILSKLMTWEDVSISKVLIEVFSRPSIESKEVMVLDQDELRAKIINALQHFEMKLSIRMRVRVSRYTLIKEDLYQISFTMPYLKCLGKDEV